MHNHRSAIPAELFVLILAVSCLIVWPQQGKGADAGQSMQKRIDLDDPPYQNYPKKMSGMGTIDRIGTDEIVIDDSAHRLSPAVTFHTPGTLFATMSELKVGQYVGYIKSRQEIVSLWLLITEN
ncbi:MAG: hypothetical protein C4530_02560 [Desulfobacteraceae bacterium]|nr:MAG: hypothetical protein C4530_02560 [Desulfobacteraceae bacterium]